MALHFPNQAPVSTEQEQINLSNHFLIAMPSLDDPFFSESVVYLCEHNEDGAMGVIINKPTPISMDIIFFADGRTMPERFQNQYVMMGGPVQIDRGFVVHTPIGNWQSSLTIDDHTALTTSRDILEQLSQDDSIIQNVLLSIGYSSWSAGQLEKELSENTWLTVPADHDILFKTAPEDCYHAALAKLGIRPETLMSKAAYA